MKFVVELDDFYLDEEEDLIPAIKNEVIIRVTNQVWDMIKETVNKSVTNPLVTEIKGQIDKKINESLMIELENVLKTQKFKEYSKEITFAEFIENKMSASSYNNLQKTVEKLADSRADEIKKRYDLIFASQIVVKLNENGMLKEDVAKLLLEK